MLPRKILHPCQALQCLPLWYATDFSTSITDCEIFLLGDINADIMPDTSSIIACRLNNIFGVFLLDQVVAEPALIVSTQLWIFVLDSEDSEFCIVQLSISDHAQVNTIHTAHYEPTDTRMIETRFVKIFVKTNF